MMRKAIGFLRRDHPNVKKAIAGKAAARGATKPAFVPNAALASTGKSS